MSMMRVLSLPTLLLVFCAAALAQVPAGPSPAAAMQEAGEAAAQPGFSAQAIALPAVPSPLMGGIPTGKATPVAIPLSLTDAIQRGLNHNLGAVLSAEAVSASRGARLLALSQLLPHLTAGLTETQERLTWPLWGSRASPACPRWSARSMSSTCAPTFPSRS